MASQSANTQNKGPTSQQHRSSQEIVIIGAGLAGLFTALCLAPLPTIVIAAKALGGGASSLWAQGGIAAAIGEGDTPKAHAVDTINAGAGLVNPDIANIVAQDALGRITDLLQYGVPFDKNIQGKLDLAHEAAHSTRRILHVEGDKAGAAIMAAIIDKVKQTPSIHVLEQVEVHKLEAKDNQITAVYLWPSKSKGFGQGHRLEASTIVLATGGVGHLYSKTTNPEMARGEGIAMAARCGAVIKDPEFVQFHPTAMDVGLDPAPLATEALRGDGATLINNNNERFMIPIHKDAELAPRDIVARAVYNQIKAGKGAFLDCTQSPNLIDHFPTVQENCQKAGINPKTQPIPIAPAAHFHMGGILTDENGASSIEGLWACGEVASTGLHGANRLASNSLLEAIVFGKRIAQTIQQQTNHKPSTQEFELNADIEEMQQNHKYKLIDFKPEIETLRHLMFTHVGVERNAKGLTQALSKIQKLETVLNQSERTKNMILTAKLITQAALDRQESRGSHHRTDFPQTSPKAEHTLLDTQDLKA